MFPGTSAWQCVHCNILIPAVRFLLSLQTSLFLPQLWGICDLEASHGIMFHPCCSPFAKVREESKLLSEPVQVLPDLSYVSILFSLQQVSLARWDCHSHLSLERGRRISKTCALVEERKMLMAPQWDLICTFSTDRNMSCLKHLSANNTQEFLDDLFSGRKEG